MVLLLLENIFIFALLQVRKEVMIMRMFNKKKAQKERVLSAVSKMIADKNVWLDCVQQGKPLSSLNEKGVVLSKLR